VKYKVLVDDNFNYMDEDSRYTHGSYDNAEEAIAAAQSIVDSSLESLYKEGFTADQLFEQYKSLGEDPFITPKDNSVSFSAWDYAREKCKELCI
jgi:hypothetical protein